MRYQVISMALVAQIRVKAERCRRYNDAAKLQIWRKGKVIPNANPALWRQDAMGGIMLWSAYGDRNSQFGWEVDHIIPKAAGGGSGFENLQPLYWRNNARKGAKNEYRIPHL